MYHFLIIPDTQYMAKNHPDIFLNMTKTINHYCKDHPIDAVIQLGDIVDGGGQAKNEFDTAKECFQLLDDAGIPLIFAAGNHDYDQVIGIGLTHPNPEEEGRNLSVYNHYFGYDRLKRKDWYISSYEKNRAENSYYKIRDLIILVLEFAPRDNVLDWAHQVLTNYPNKKCILITHSYMYHDGKRTSSHSEHNPIHSPETKDGNDGEMIWQKFISKQSNIIAVFSGHHVPKNISYRVDKTDKGNVVLQSFQNWQEEKYGGAGRMRLVQYDSKLDSFTLSVFNPLTKEFEHGKDYDLNIKLGGGERFLID